MAFNAMKATLVEYEDKGGDIIIGDIPINVGTPKATPVTSADADERTSQQGQGDQLQCLHGAVC